MIVQTHKQIFYKGNSAKAIYLGSTFMWPSIPNSIDYSVPFWVECITGSVLIRIISTTSATYPGGLNFNVQRSTNNTTWSDLGTTSTTALNYGLVVAGYGPSKIYLKANTDTWNTNTGAAVKISLLSQGGPGTCKIGGNIMSLLYGTGFTNQKEFPANSTYNFSNVFDSSSGLTDASELVLPARTLTTSCYANLFSNCTSLEKSPILRATTLTNSCYSNMFNGSTSLNEVTCCATSGINENNSTTDWLLGVASAGTFYKKAGITWPAGTSGIPSGWTVVEQ